MVGSTFFGNVDLASVAIWMFWIFFAGLVYYLQTENMREGYPLQDEVGNPAPNQGPFPVPKPKTVHLRNGRGSVDLPSVENEQSHMRDNLALAQTSTTAGSPYVPTGDPMIDGVGPASWAPRRDVPELDAEGHPKIQPMSNMPAFHVAAGRDPRGKAVVGGDGEVVGRVIDMWIDLPEQLVRYLTVDLNPEGSGQTRLIPMNMARIKSDRVVVRSLYAHNWKDVPQAKSDAQVTLLEEEKIMAFYGGGTLYASPHRIEPAL